MLINVGYCFDNRSFVLPLDGSSEPRAVVEDRSYVTEISWLDDGLGYFCTRGLLWRLKP
jgi:hypothetical protein